MIKKPDRSRVKHYLLLICSLLLPLSVGYPLLTGCGPTAPWAGARPVDPEDQNPKGGGLVRKDKGFTTIVLQKDAMVAVVGGQAVRKPITWTVPVRNPETSSVEFLSNDSEGNARVTIRKGSKTVPGSTIKFVGEYEDLSGKKKQLLHYPVQFE